jgi:type IV pilus assembly protein PilB
MDTTSDFLIEAGISAEVIALVPGPIALENLMLPFSATEDSISILFAAQPEEELLQKLAFILRRQVLPSLAKRVAILAAIDHYYGRSAYESLPAMLISTTDWKLRCDVEEE